jgi:putative glutamine amidotransferase
MKRTGISRCDRKFEFYLKWLESAGIKYIILDYKNNNFDDIKECSSLLLTGGDDIFPEFYNDWEDGRDRSKYIPERDGFEFRLFDYALNKSLPILGICRGMQLINVRLNGSLISDIETVRGTNHKKISDTEDRVHSVTVLENTLLHEIVENINGIISSSHHQAIDRLGEGLMITAKADDGIIEAVEWTDKKNKQFMLGIQWHPERMKDLSNTFNKNILLRFKKETERSSYI